MKRVLRSCITPLPRFLTTRGLAGLVLVLVAGTALSVHEYLQTARAPRAAQVRSPALRGSSSGEVRAAERSSHGERSSASARTYPARTTDFSSVSDVSPAAPSATGSSIDAGARPATLYRPDDAASGS